LPQADPLSRSFTVKIRLDNADRSLHAGNVVTARIATGSVRHAVTLPPQAVQRYADGALYAWTIDPQRHTAVRQIVEAGQLQGAVVEITSGLKPGDVVVTSVPLTLFEGMPLQADFAP
jgi:cobalt-zinc-cadmium efflux system membrane fusion protein